MIALIFDTETTGFLNKDLPLGDPQQSRIVQLAAELHDGNKVLSELNVIINPCMDIPVQSSNIHGITNEIANKCGIELSSALAVFYDMVKTADIAVAHNASFDLSILATEAVRVRYLDLLARKEVFCTMLKSMNILKLPGKYGNYKWPTLQQAYKYFIDSEGFDGAHNAMEDVRACRKVFYKLKESENV